MTRAFGIAGIALAMVVIAWPVAAAAGSQDVANSISEQVMSPFCPGVTLHDCPSDNALQLRHQIAVWAGRGWTRQRIMGKLLAEYGPDIRAVPADHGASLLVWLLPGAGVLAGAATAGVLARRWSRHSPTRGPTPQLSPNDRRRLEEELAVVRGEL
ncbi:MAG: cytochrome c-type biogenesis protein CcmH [Actinomycetota bacterium]|nr:cytochrome c-type biogenesis protein CcmH [Actinomycetota bacterium]